MLCISDFSSSVWSIYPGCVINRVCANIFLSIWQVEQLIFFHQCHRLEYINAASVTTMTECMELDKAQYMAVNLMDATKVKDAMSVHSGSKSRRLHSLCRSVFLLVRASDYFLPGRTLVFILATSRWNTSSCTDRDTPAVQFGRWMALALVSGSAWSCSFQTPKRRFLSVRRGRRGQRNNSEWQHKTWPFA